MPLTRDPRLLLLDLHPDPLAELVFGEAQAALLAHADWRDVQGRCRRAVPGRRRRAARALRLLCPGRRRRLLRDPGAARPARRRRRRPAGAPDRPPGAARRRHRPALGRGRLPPGHDRGIPGGTARRTPGEPAAAAGGRADRPGRAAGRDRHRARPRPPGVPRRAGTLPPRLVVGRERARHRGRRGSGRTPLRARGTAGVRPRDHAMGAARRRRLRRGAGPDLGHARHHRGQPRRRARAGPVVPRHRARRRARLRRRRQRDHEPHRQRDRCAGGPASRADRARARGGQPVHRRHAGAARRLVAGRTPARRAAAAAGPGRRGLRRQFRARHPGTVALRRLPPRPRGGAGGRGPRELRAALRRPAAAARYRRDLAARRGPAIRRDPRPHRQCRRHLDAGAGRHPAGDDGAAAAPRAGTRAGTCWRC